MEVQCDATGCSAEIKVQQDDDVVTGNGDKVPMTAEFRIGNYSYGEHKMATNTSTSVMFSFPSITDEQELRDNILPNIVYIIFDKSGNMPQCAKALAESRRRSLEIKNDQNGNGHLTCPITLTVPPMAPAALHF